METLNRYLLILLGGGLGALARFALGSAITDRVGARFPWGTMAVNLSGSFLIGLLMVTLAERGAPHPHWQLFLVVGVLGGYTTFSSFSWESYTLLRDGEFLLAAWNTVGSAVLGLAAVWLGATLALRR